MRAPSKSSIASSRFDTGPASAVIAMPCFGFLKYRMSTGTGFAQPKPTSSIAAKPNQSMWCSGFKLKRCSRLAVGSPRA